MWMAAACVDLEFPVHLTTEPCLWQHSSNCLFNDAFGMLCLHSGNAAKFESAGIAGVALDHALFSLAAGEHDLLCIGHDDESFHALVFIIGD